MPRQVHQRPYIRTTTTIRSMRMVEQILYVSTVTQVQHRLTVPMVIL